MRMKLEEHLAHNRTAWVVNDRLICTPTSLCLFLADEFVEDFMVCFHYREILGRSPVSCSSSNLLMMIGLPRLSFCRNQFQAVMIHRVRISFPFALFGSPDFSQFSNILRR